MRPAWQVREHAGITSWYQVRLAFPDGARVDALAVVSGGGVSIEDVQAQPALSLADLAALADWIRRPLSEACGVRMESAGGRRHGYGGGAEEWREGDGGERAEGAGEACPEGAGGGRPVGGAEGCREGAGGGRPEGASEACPEDAGGRSPGAGGPTPQVVGGSTPQVVGGSTPRAVGGEAPYTGARPSMPRARPAWPRGMEGRRRAAQEYRAAQEDGADPVLAVMRATGHSRRRSLRLIAQARDAGYLTPRHARR
ncbi:DUF6214 family protein [Streptomyces sp. NPDC051133]|uniref:DUF6214 family protein n=1 Tax=Streptomyces sp. NPDC051133 TaxID=3155521 RepID=UPI00344AD0C3